MINRRDFMKTGGLAVGSVLVGSGAAQEQESLKIPEKGATYQRENGQLVFIARGLVYSTSNDEGRTWSKSKPLLNHDQPVRSDSHVLGLKRLASGKLALCYGRRQSVGNFKRQEIFLRLSEDDGRTWSEEQSVTPLPGDDLNALHGSLIQLSSGRLILPTYTSFSHNYVGRPHGIGHTWLPEYYSTYMLFSDDEGKTWDQSSGLSLWKDMGHGGVASCGEACVAEAQDGRLIMLARTTNMRVLRSYSKDGGKTWSLVELTDLNSSNAPIRLVRIPSTGDLLIVWNQVTAQEHRDGFGRSRLSTAISKDFGQTWQHFKNLELCPGMDDKPHVVDTEPPQFVRTGDNTHPGQSPDNSIRGIIRNSYANVHFFNGKVFVDHDHWLTPNLWAGKGERRDVHQKLHLLPVEWFYT